MKVKWKCILSKAHLACSVNKKDIQTKYVRILHKYKYVHKGKLQVLLYFTLKNENLNCNTLRCCVQVGVSHSVSVARSEIQSAGHPVIHDASLWKRVICCLDSNTRCLMNSHNFCLCLYYCIFTSDSVQFCFLMSQIDNVSSTVLFYEYFIFSFWFTFFTFNILF